MRRRTWSWKSVKEALTPGPNFNRPVKDLVYKDLLTITFTQVRHDRGIKTWSVSVSYPQCITLRVTLTNIDDPYLTGSFHPSFIEEYTSGLLMDLQKQDGDIRPIL